MTSITWYEKAKESRYKYSKNTLIIQHNPSPKYGPLSDFYWTLITLYTVIRITEKTL